MPQINRVFSLFHEKYKAFIEDQTSDNEPNCIVPIIDRLGARLHDNGHLEPYEER